MSASITGRVTRVVMLGAAACSVALISACSSTARPETAAALPSGGAAAPSAGRASSAPAPSAPGPAGADSPAPGSPAAGTTGAGYLTAIRVAKHPAYDRMVFQFAGRVPGYKVGYVAAVTHDGSGQPVPLPGQASLQVVFNPASGTRQDGTTAYTGPSTLAPFLPTLLQVSSAGDFEGYLRFGVGLSGRAGYHAFTLTNPARVVIDVTHAPLPAFPGVWDITSWRQYWSAQASVEQGHQPWLLRPSSVVKAWAAGWASNATVAQTGPDRFTVTKPGQMATVTVTRPVRTGPAPIWVISHISYAAA
jgi:hypothetical protein